MRHEPFKHLRRAVGAASLMWVTYSLVEWLAPEALCRVGSSPHCAEASMRALNATPPDSAAARYATRGCDRGHSTSCNNLGVCYERGVGVTKRDDDALRQYRKACDLGLGLGCFNVATLLHRTEGDAEAVTAQLVRACSQGWADGCRTASPRHWKDLPRATELANRGCELGSSRSCHLATLLLATTHPEDVAARDGVVTLTESCSKDEANACAVLAMLAAAGRGVPRDLDRARTLADRACRHGIESACTMTKPPERLEALGNGLREHGPVYLLEVLSKVRP